MTLFQPDDPQHDPYGYRADAVRFERQQRRRRRSAVFGVLAVILAVALAVLLADPQRRTAYADQWVVWTQPPSAEVQGLADATHMTETGRRIFFATTPEIDASAEFNQHCQVEAEIVLGCYEDGAIFVFRVTDARLTGTTEVTAAHEMLHAAYQRMDAAERRRIDGLVAAFVATLPADDPTVKLMATYPADQHADEWHSRLGTEYADLGPGLEKHYAEYFGDRGAVLALAQGSRAQLDAAESSINQLVSQLDALDAEIASRSAAFEADRDRLNADIADFNSRADDGDFASEQQFDTERDALQRRSDSLDAERADLNADIARYNDLADELKRRDSDYTELYSHLDSHA